MLSYTSITLNPVGGVDPMITSLFVAVRLYAVYKNQIEDAIRFWNELRDEARIEGNIENIQFYNELANEAWRLGRRLRVPGSL